MKGVFLNADCPSNLRLVADRTLFQGAIGNLLTNAIANTPSKECIAVVVSQKGNGIEVIVKDSGEGIKPDELPRVFDRLYRGAIERQTTTGHGLGLSIVKSIFELHSGTVEILQYYFDHLLKKINSFSNCKMTRKALLSKGLSRKFERL